MSNEKDRATPRPWSVSRNNAGAIPPHFQPPEILGRGGHACVAAQLGNGPEAEANAALIVRAVNSHDKLVEALTELESIAHRMGGEHPRFDTLNNATGKAIAALALARGEVQP